MLVEAGGDTGIQQIGKICEKKRKKTKTKRPKKRKKFPHAGVEPGLSIR